MQQEARKTITFVLVAAMAVLVAWEPWRSAPASNSVPSEVGTKLFPKFSDPLAAKSLEVVTYDEDTSTIADFKVAQTNGVWSIPSHSDYPADAKEHMAQAATSLLDLKILNVASTNAGDKEYYGVVSPDPQKLRPGDKGVGTRITLKGDKDLLLADLVIGKNVKDQPAQRYVRRADHDQIYLVEARTDKFSTKFEDWIEKDLLKLNAFDVQEVDLKDYSTQAGPSRSGGIAVGIAERSRIRLAYDDAKSNWNVIEMTAYDEKGQPSPAKLADDEELNTEKLNGLKTALDDLKIVDVERKPSGLSRDLRATEEFTKNAEAMQSLFTRGFYPVQRDGQNEMLSTEGEVACTTKDGVRYVLRFGNLAGGAPAAKEEAKEGETKSNPALNRFLFVMAQFDESRIPKPQLEPLPGDDTPAAEATDQKPSDEKAEPKADENKTIKKKAEEKATPAVPEEKTADDDTPAPKAKKTKKKSTAKAKPATEAKTATAEEPKANDTKADAPADEAKESATPKGDAPAKDEAAKSDAPATDKKDDKPATPAAEQRIAIERENKRKQDEYDAAVKKGQDKVQELNDRFADWYFVISDDVYKKIHLGHDDIVRKKEVPLTPDKPAAGKEPGIGDLQQLQQGLKDK